MAIHVYAGEEGGFSVWTDCEPGHFHSGRCLGHGETLAAAVAEARTEVEADLAQLAGPLQTVRTVNDRVCDEEPEPAGYGPGV